MLVILKNLLLSLRDKLHAAKDPVGFARSLGVRVGKNVRFYGVSRGTFGSEPWLIKIGNNCHITAGVQFVNHDGGTLILRNECPSLEWTAPIELGNDVYVGIRAIILPGVKVGDRCVVGAGSVVTKDIPSNSVFAGVPARRICSTDEYLKKLKGKSLGCGHLKGEEKARVIQGIYKEMGWFEAEEEQ